MPCINIFLPLARRARKKMVLTFNLTAQSQTGCPSSRLRCFEGLTRMVRLDEDYQFKHGVHWNMGLSIASSQILPHSRGLAKIL